MQSMSFSEWIAALASSLAMTRGQFRSGLPRFCHCSRSSVIAAVCLSLRAESEAIHVFFRMDCRARKLARNDAGAVPFWIATLLSLQPFRLSLQPFVCHCEPKAKQSMSLKQPPV
jgi:hypothetical protein